MTQIQVTEETAVAVSTTEAVVDITVDATPQVIEVGIIGPQGPQGIQGPIGASTLSELTDVNVGQKVNNSILYYDQSADLFVANDVNTIITITDGGAF